MAARSRYNRSKGMSGSRGSGFYKKARNRPQEFTSNYKFISVIEETVQRHELYEHVGNTVQFSGELTMKTSTKTSPKPLVLENVVVCGEFIDHVWVELSKDDWDKLAILRGTVRIFCTGDVYKYGVAGGKTKIGLSKVELLCSTVQ